MRYYWRQLGIKPTHDVRAIKKAYAKKLKTTRPDDDMAAYQSLRSAYEWAIESAQYIIEDAIDEGDDNNNEITNQVDETVNISHIAQPENEEEPIKQSLKEDCIWTTESTQSIIEDVIDEGDDNNNETANQVDETVNISQSEQAEDEEMVWSLDWDSSDEHVNLSQAEAYSVSEDDFLQLIQRTDIDGKGYAQSGPLSLEAIMAWLDHIRSTEGSFKLAEYWPQLRHYLDELPLNETSNASIAMADFVLSDYNTAEDFLAYLADYFAWGRDIYSVQMLGSERAEDLNCLLHQYLLISFPLTQEKEPMALGLYHLLKSAKSLLDQWVAFILAFLTSPDLSRELDAGFTWDLVMNRQKWHKKFYPVLHNLLLVKSLQFVLFISIAFVFFAHVSSDYYSQNLEKSMNIAVSYAFISLLVFFVFSMLLLNFGSDAFKYFLFSVKGQAIFNLILPACFLILVVLLNAPYWASFNVAYLNQYDGFDVLISFVFLFCFINKLFLLFDDSYKIIMLTFLVSLIGVDLFGVVSDTDMVYSPLSWLALLWWNIGIFIWLNWKEVIWALCQDVYNDLRPFHKMQLVYILFSVVISPVIVCVLVLLLPIFILDFIERYRLGYLFLALLISFMIVDISYTAFLRGYLPYYLDSISVAIACVLPVFLFVQMNIYKKSISFLNQYLDTKISMR